jgi:hypothetical protein
MNEQTNNTLDEQIRYNLIDSIDDRRFDNDFPAINYNDVIWIVDNCLLKNYKQLITKSNNRARIEELKMASSLKLIRRISYESSSYMDNRINQLQTILNKGYK